MSRVLSTAVSTLGAFVVFAGCLPASAQSCCDRAAQERAPQDLAPQDLAAQDRAASEHATRDHDATTIGMPGTSTQPAEIIASRSPYRISRRKIITPAELQQADISENPMLLFDNRVDVSKQFNKWKEDYVRPVVCPVLMCHGNCAKTDLGCKGIYGSILGGMNSCCLSAPPVVQPEREPKGVFPIQTLDD